MKIMKVKKAFYILLLAAWALGLGACSEDESNLTTDQNFPNLVSTFSGTIDFDNLPNYANQSLPFYITKSNSGINNQITDRGAVLGRILFYDKSLSSNGTVSCASCHVQRNGFSDTNTVSTGVNGITARHSMRLVNARFSDEANFFWDERATSLENQTTRPIRDHNEMGFSGQGGAPSFGDLLNRLQSTAFYQELFAFVFGDASIDENRMQIAISQFIRSIQSFDSKYDQGRNSVANDLADFPNFTADENAGKRLFMRSRANGGANCASCHRPPEFDIDPSSGNNGVIGAFGGGTDLAVTRSPTLRDLVNPDGALNGPMMHNGSMTSLEQVIEHYNSGVVDNPALDGRLRQGGVPQNLGLSAAEKNQLVQFLKTLTGSAVYTDPRWSNPF